MTDTRLDRLIERARAEFREMPGLRLSPRQMQRLWAIDPATCDILVQRLLQTRIVMRTPSGLFVRFGDRERTGLWRPAHHRERAGRSRAQANASADS